MANTEWYSKASVFHIDSTQVNRYKCKLWRCMEGGRRGVVGNKKGAIEAIHLNMCGISFNSTQYDLNFNFNLYLMKLMMIDTNVFRYI